ncbi:hypothetical protein DFR37_1421 [Eoetvoesiella caeni]|uniref:Uncharacterized protein n=1 Tax=Eoetvoesiella caeni TaxID=645616 RepID=A0A366GW49_9BURK|nr:hypothetical protein DFR37_1421 [Eoetvoesiella caeni]
MPPGIAVVVEIVEGVRTPQRFFQANPLLIFKIVLRVIRVGLTVVHVVDDELMQMPTLPPHGPEQGHVQFTQGNVGRHQNRSVDQRSAVTLSRVNYLGRCASIILAG